MRFSPWALAAVMLSAQAARAQSPASPDAPTPESTQARAAALYKEGARLFKEGKFREASERFEAAYVADPSPILLYNLARAAEELGDGDKAMFNYRTYLASNPAAEDRAEVERRIRVLEKFSKPKTATIALLQVPEGATVTFDGLTPTPPGPDGRYLLGPGNHVVTVTAPNGRSERREVTLQGGESAQLDFSALKAAAFEAPYNGQLRPWGWAAVGTGAAITVAGMVFGVKAQGAVEDFNAVRREIARTPRPADPAERASQEVAFARKLSAARDDAESSATWANVGYSVGGASLLAGAVLLIVDATRTSDAATFEKGTSTALIPLPGGFGVGLGGAF